MRLLLILWGLACVLAPITRATAPETAQHTNNLLVINCDPILREHGSVHLQTFLHWNDPRPMTTNLIRYIRESSGGYANFRLVDWIDSDAFPTKRDGFRYTEQSFLEMWRSKDKEKTAHQPDRCELRCHLQGIESRRAHSAGEDH
ncbi:MAG: hypothetical protein EXS36_19645 [Pedosphaera sp.]|nr:hypothetical protein [Pedosphaera sp.]